MMSILTKVQNVGFATLLLSASIFLSRFIGLLRDKLISWNFGATGETDVYFIAFIIPDFINYLLAGGYFSIILVPLLTQYFTLGEKQGFRFFNSVLITVACTIFILTSVLWFLTPSIVPLIAKDFRPDQYEQLILFIRIILPGQIFFLIGAVFSALLYMRKQFVVPALMPLIYNISIIIFGVALQKHGMVGYCYGVTVGAFLGAFLLPFYTVIKGGFQFSFILKHKGLISFVVLALPLMLGQSITVLEEQFIRIFGTYLSDGSVSILSYARRIMLLPIGVVAQAIGVASYPFLATMIANNNIHAFTVTLRTALHNTLAVLIPLTVFMFLMSEHIIAILFYGGEFIESFVVATTPLLQYLLIGVPAWGIQQVLVRGFYANNDTIRPTIVGTLVTFASLPLYYYGAMYYDAMGVALASTIAITLYMLILCLVWRIRYYKDVFSGFFLVLAFSILEIIPPILVIFYIAPYLTTLLRVYYAHAYFFSNIIALTAYSIIFILIYITTLYCSNSPRLILFYRLLRK